MIAVIQQPGQLPHVTRWTGRRGLKVSAITYCNIEFPAGEGVLQLPDDAKICVACEKGIKEAQYARR